MIPTERALALRLARAKARAIQVLLATLEDPATSPAERRRIATVILRAAPQDAEPSLDPADADEAEHDAPLRDPPPLAPPHPPRTGGTPAPTQADHPAFATPTSTSTATSTAGPSDLLHDVLPILRDRRPEDG